MKAYCLIIATYTDKTRKAWICFVQGSKVHNTYITLKEANRAIKAGLTLDREETEANITYQIYKIAQ